MSSPSRRLAAAVAALALAAFTACDGASSYRDSVQPIFERKCTQCHWQGTPIGYQLVDPFDPETGVVGRATSWLMARNAIVVVPGKPGESSLVDKIRAADLDPALEGASMPISVAPLTSAELESIRLWIAQGANDDEAFRTSVAPIFGDGRSIGAGSGKCSYCHTTLSTHPPNLADPFDPVRGVVNVPALVGGVRVVPGDPEGSVLYQKIVASNVPAGLGRAMPLRIGRINAAEFSAIEAWIRAGAKDD